MHKKKVNEINED